MTTLDQIPDESILVLYMHVLCSFAVSIPFK